MKISRACVFSPACLVVLVLLLLPFQLDAQQEETWTPIGPGGGSVTALAVAPNGRTLYAGTQNGGVFKSINTGRSWSPVNQGLRGAVNDLEVHPRDFRIVYAATSQGLFQSRDAGASSLDAGATWTEVITDIGGITHLRFDPADPNTLYGLLSQSYPGKSTDGGAHWTLLSPQSPFFGASVLTLVAGPPTAVYANGLSVPPEGGYFEDHVRRSTDGGATWTSISTGLPPADIVDLQVDPYSPGTVYAATFGGGIYVFTCEH